MMMPCNQFGPQQLHSMVLRVVEWFFKPYGQAFDRDLTWCVVTMRLKMAMPGYEKPIHSGLEYIQIILIGKHSQVARSTP